MSNQQQQASGAPGDLREEERTRLAAALFVSEYDSVDIAVTAGFCTVRADKMALVAEAVAKAGAEDRYVVMALTPLDGHLVQYITDIVPDATVLNTRWPATCSSFGAMLRFARDPELQRDLVIDWLVDRGDDGPNTWPATEPHPSDTKEGPQPFPLHSLPAACRAIVDRGAQAQGVDPTFWAVPLLGIAAGCIGASRRIALKPGWEEPSPLWTAIVAPSGSGKSPPLRTLLQAVRRRDRELRDLSEGAREAAEAAAREWEGKKGRAGNGQLPTGPKPELPPRRCCIVQDITIEALATRLRDNPRGLLLGVDELGQWLRSFQRYRGGQGSDEQQWLSMHNADAVVVDRQSSAPICVPNAAVSIVGTIQPPMARKLLGAEQRSSGLAARLLLAEPRVDPVKWSDETIPDDVTFAWSRVVGSLLDLSHDSDTPRVLTLSSSARDAFVDFHDKNGREGNRAVQSGDYDLAAVLSKLRGTAARIAMLFELAQAAENGTAELVTEVGVESMRNAITVTRWFETEARRIYDAWARATPASEQALDARVLTALRSAPKSRNELRDHFHRNLPSAELTASLRRLQMTGQAHPRKESTGGRPSEIWTATATDNHHRGTQIG